MKKADGELVRRSAGESSRTRLSLVTILVKKIGQGAPENNLTPVVTGGGGGGNPHPLCFFFYLQHKRFEIELFDS